ncbi:integrase core domain-containing protein [Nonomuraea insulae]|uniref:Integrase core domain-containing protein n=1 Tax=Nonomuraea insulae TaxID=1616787 RepID=A0ABW1CN48_9ACTN
MALSAIATHFGRPGTPTEQAWIETLSGHLKAEFPHLTKITEPAVLRAELARVRVFYNGTRLHEGLGYVTPDDEHEGRGPKIRKARQEGALNNPANGARSGTARTGAHHPHGEPPMPAEESAICIIKSETPQPLLSRVTAPSGRGEVRP